MQTERICPSCYKRLPADAPRGVCPECLMKAGFGTGAAPGPGEPTSPMCFMPPPVAEMAKLFPNLEVVEVLGAGGMGAVYKARQPALDRWVALKILPPQATGKPGFAERFNREARALARLNHPGIVGVHEFGQAGGMPYFLMEYVDGLTLRHLVQQQRLPPREALQIVPQICEALQYAHDEGVVHRDIKPENILLDKKGRVKIADFGIAKILGHEGERLNLTAETQVVGTPHYMAPEQIEHPQAVDHRADIYSLGVVFYEMLTGELPLGKFAPPSEKAKIDVRLDQVVLHALEKEPQRRYQYASQVKTDVETIANGPGGRSDGRLVATGAGEEWRSRGWVRASAFAIAAVVIALLFFYFPSRPTTTVAIASSQGGIVFPPDAGVVDVTKPPYNVRPDGQMDATAAIQQALTDYRTQNAIIYLPNGVYLVSDTLHWGRGPGDTNGCKRVTLQGQSREGTIIRLHNACTVFADPALPKAVICTGPKGVERSRNSVRDLTVDTGQNNPGAIGVQLNAANVGCLRDVVIRSGDGQGKIGLDMAYTDPIGPLLVKNVKVAGFDVGIHTRDSLMGQTFEHITLEEQNQVGFLNDGENVCIRDLRTRGRVPAIRNIGKSSLAVVVDAELNGHDEASSHAAIINRPGLFVRNVKVNGFALAIAHEGQNATNVPGPLVQEWASGRLPNSGVSLNLPVKETPEVPWDPPEEWANVVTFGAKPDLLEGDDSGAIQRAIDSGKTTVYLPRGEYMIGRRIEVRGKVRRLIGCEANLRSALTETGNDPLLTVVEGEAPVVMIERISIDFGTNFSFHLTLDNRSSRTLVLREFSGGTSEFTGSGDVFLEDVGGRMAFHGQKVWARQLAQATRQTMPRDQWWHLRNDGGQVWVLGQVTSGPGSIAITTGGGETELLGGMSYVNAMAKEQPDPAYIVEKGSLSVCVNEVNHGNLAYSVLVRRIENGVATDLLMPSQAPGGVNASLIPLFSTSDRAGSSR